MSECFFQDFMSSLGAFGIVWEGKPERPVVLHIYLPNTRRSLVSLVERAFGPVRRSQSPAVTDLGGRVKAVFAGEPVDFDLGILALDRCPAFQQKVLRAEYGIPRGWVSTYGRIARHVGVPGGARAVGNALGANPFPVVIPCHRAIRSDGSLGGFRGGLAMKRTLLELEGVEFTGRGKVVMERVFY